MEFWRIYNNTLYLVDTVEHLGWSDDNMYVIPDEYLEQQIFTICRTCFGIGDWGILSAMPRLLKEKYPNCTVQIPSEKLQQQIFSSLNSNEWLSSWSNPFKTSEYIFRNNPYVDAFIDHVSDEIYTDHYRIFNLHNKNIPLLEQMLKFWQFTSKEYEDSSPELYFSEEEQEIACTIIGEYASDTFGTLLISNRYDEKRDGEFIRNILAENKIPYFYYIKAGMDDFDFMPALDLRHIPVRIQLCIKSKANLLIGNQSGMDITFPRYTSVYMAPKNKFGLGSNVVKGNLITEENES